MGTSYRRDRHGRGVRGALAPASVPITQTSAERFEQIVLSGLDRLERRWLPGVAPVDLRTVAVAVEDIPALGSPTTEVPLGDLQPGPPPRLVVYRRPVEHRTETVAELTQVVNDVVTELVAELFDMSPEDVDPDYE